MLGDILLFYYNGTLKAEPVGGEGAGYGIVAQAPANLWEDGDLVENGAQDGLVVLDAGICSFLALIQQTLYMLCVMCQRECHGQQASKEANSERGRPYHIQTSGCLEREN